MDHQKGIINANGQNEERSEPKDGTIADTEEEEEAEPSAAGHEWAETGEQGNWNLKVVGMIEVEKKRRETQQTL
jgi:hypothetical protein